MTPVVENLTDIERVLVMYEVSASNAMNVYSLFRYYSVIRGRLFLTQNFNMFVLCQSAIVCI